jgi:hypothetical protein
MFIEEGDQIVSKTYMTRVEGENTSPFKVVRLNLILALTLVLHGFNAKNP